MDDALPSVGDRDNAVVKRDVFDRARSSVLDLVSHLQFTVSEAVACLFSLLTAITDLRGPQGLGTTFIHRR